MVQSLLFCAVGTAFAVILVNYVVTLQTVINKLEMAKIRKYTGLSQTEVDQSRASHGANVLTPPAKTPWWIKLLEKFKDPLIIVLLVAGVLSVGISFYEYFGLGESSSVFFEPVGIFIAILLATGMAFVFEWKADREFAVLNKVNDDEPVEVVRDGNVKRVPKRDVVVGDVVILNTGEEVPADAVLLESTAMQIDESSLTGEPVCAKTTIEADFDSDATFPSNCVMRGTKVMEGHGVCRVTAVGDATENGKVYEAAQIDDSVKTPLNEQLDGLSRFITWASYAAAALVVVGRVFFYFAFSGQANPFQWVDFLAFFLQTIMIAVTLIVVAVPEGLPMAVTLSLAYSMRRMLKTSNLVRRMHACETMGATTVICTDKTGTLTQNQMRVSRTNFYGLDGSQRLGSDDVSRHIAEGIAVNSTAQLDFSNPEAPQVIGNPTEGALLLWLDSNGINYHDVKDAATELEQIPFNTERKYMATIVRSAIGGRRVLYVKGATEIIHPMCSSVCGNVKRSDTDSQLLAYQQKAMRTLGFAYRVLDEDEQPIADGRIVADNLTFMGIVAISDPVRPEVPAAVAECRNAGIAVKIVTGDTPGTAREIGRQIGLWTSADTDGRNLVTGPEFASLSDAQLDERVADIKIIARARPMDKKRLVEALQRQGQVVAVTGDGTNDAPALKAAHVGLSMGDGTSVAKEASDITIIDNSFSSIGRAVMWGRSLYQNIQRFILFQMTVNVAACIVVLAGSVMGTDAPLNVTQMLWVNLIMDTFAAMALASLPPDHNVMRQPPRDRRKFIINPSMSRFIVAVGGLFSVLLVALFWLIKDMDVDSIGPSYFVSLLHSGVSNWHSIKPYESSIFFTTFVMMQFWNMFNARAFATGHSALRLKGCRGFLLIALLIFFGQILIVSFGGEMFNLQPLKLLDWVIIVVGTSPVLLIGEFARLLHRH